MAVIGAFNEKKMVQQRNFVRAETSIWKHMESGTPIWQKRSSNFPCISLENNDSAILNCNLANV
jgi:hypothetical protein